MSLTLFRHAPTADNEADVFMGWADAPLSEDWWKQNGKTFAVLPPALFSSPLKRARETAVRLFPGVVARLDDRLRERGLGHWQGLSKEQVRRTWPEAFDGEQLDAAFTPPGGESLQDLRSRIESFLGDVGDLGQVTVVTHNGWIRTARWVMGEIAVEEIYREKVPYLEAAELVLRKS